jgi:hypothetical protein
MASPLILTSVIPSEKERAPVKMSAVISPTENPATAMQFSTAPLFCTTDLQNLMTSVMERNLICFNADPDSEPGSQTNADPCGSGSWSDFMKSQKVEVYIKIYLK